MVENNILHFTGMSLSKATLQTNLEVDVFLLGHLGNLFQQAPKPMLRSMGDIFHHVRAQFC